MSFFKSILDFFSRLFGGGKNNDDPGPADTGGETTTETPTGDEESFWEDGADVPADSVVTEVPVAEIDEVLTLEAEPDPALTGTGGDEEPARVPRYLWCLDNGHGKATAGKRSPKFDDGSQFFEFEFTRDINARVMQGLDALGIQYFNVVPEVEGDVKLSERCSRANGKESDLPKIYLSIHSNAAGNGQDWNSAAGMETWFHGNSAKGKALASTFQRHIMKVRDWKDRGIRYHGDTNKAFYVLRKTSMPAVLTENGFYTNLAECTDLRDEETRQKIAQAHIDAIVEIEDNGMANIETYHKVSKL